MPGSQTTPGPTGARNNAPADFAFRQVNNVSTRIDNGFAAQWLAYTLPYRRFADVLADRLRTDRGRRGLLLLHRSGLSPHTPCQSPGALTRVAACTLARSPMRPLFEGFSHFVTSMTAPIASGWSESPGGPCTHLSGALVSSGNFSIADCIFAEVVTASA